MFGRRDRLLRRAVRERFVITTHTGATFEGLLDQIDGRTVTLVDAGALDERGGRRPIDGRLFLDRAQIAYMQEPGR